MLDCVDLAKFCLYYISSSVVFFVFILLCVFMCVYVCNSIRASVSGLPDAYCPVFLTIKSSFIHSFIHSVLTLTAALDRSSRSMSAPVTDSRSSVSRTKHSRTTATQLHKISKVLSISLPSVGPGADPGAQAVNPQVTLSHPSSSRLPLLSARPALASVAFIRWRQSHTR